MSSRVTFVLKEISESWYNTEKLRCVCCLAQMNVPETQMGCTALHPVWPGATNLLQECGTTQGVSAGPQMTQEGHVSPHTATTANYRVGDLCCCFGFSLKHFEESCRSFFHGHFPQNPFSQFTCSCAEPFPKL